MSIHDSYALYAFAQWQNQCRNAALGALIGNYLAFIYGAPIYQVGPQVCYGTHNINVTFETVRPWALQ